MKTLLVQCWATFGLQFGRNPFWNGFAEVLNNLRRNVIWFLYKNILKLFWRYWRWTSVPHCSLKNCPEWSNDVEMWWLYWPAREKAEVHLHILQTMTERFRPCQWGHCRLGKLHRHSQITPGSRDAAGYQTVPVLSFRYSARKSNIVSNEYHNNAAHTIRVPLLDPACFPVCSANVSYFWCWDSMKDGSLHHITRV